MKKYDSYDFKITSWKISYYCDLCLTRNFISESPIFFIGSGRKSAYLEIRLRSTGLMGRRRKFAENSVAYSRTSLSGKCDANFHIFDYLSAAHEAIRRILFYQWSSL